MYIIQKKTASRLAATSMAVALLASPVSSILSGGPSMSQPLRLLWTSLP